MCGIFLVAALYSYSTWKTKYLNGFIRNLPSHIVLGERAVRLPNASWYLSGMDSINLYLANSSIRNKLLIVNYRTYDTKMVTLTVADTIHFTKNVMIKVKENRLYLFDGLRPALLEGQIPQGRFNQVVKPLFNSSAIPLSPNSFVFRVYGKEKQNVLIKSVNGKIIARYVLEKQGDGIFSTDGTMNVDQTGTKIFYNYYYHNRITCLDTNLKVIYLSKTIDTVNHAQLKIGRIKSLHQLTLSAPPLFVNKQCTANCKYIFVHSALKADNEIGGIFKNYNPIDVYNSNDGSYLQSFYVINLKGEKMKDFRVFGNTLISLYDHYIYIHRLKF